eukprot:scaffold319_cov244-Pinguiococcus_pyrenoidosus.AAC.22
MEPATPVWPEVFHSQLVQNRSGNMAIVVGDQYDCRRRSLRGPASNSIRVRGLRHRKDLYYDWPGGRNLNVIVDAHDDLGVLFDNERNNGSTYYYHPEHGDCKVIGACSLPCTGLAARPKAASARY